MSDESERETQNLGIALLAVYTLLRQVCRLLPIPIELPDFEGDTLRGQEMNEAVSRVVDLIEDEPISEELQAGIWGSALHWLSASHLFSHYMGTGDHIVALEVRINIVHAHDALHEVEAQLLEDRSDE